jgi:transposase
LDKIDCVHSEETKEKAKQLRTKGLTNVEIAKKLGVYRRTLQNWLPRKNKSTIKMPIQRNEAFQLWNTGLYSKAEIARKIGVHRKTVLRWLNS